MPSLAEQRGRPRAGAARASCQYPPRPIPRPAAARPSEVTEGLITDVSTASVSSAASGERD